MKQLNIKQWWAWLEWISKANKPTTNAECSPDNPQQLNHHRWKKHTMYPNYISNDSKQSTIAERSYGTHMWQYISNIDCMFKYIGDTNCDETWWMHFRVYLFSDAHFWTWAPTIIVSTLSSLLKKHKDKLCFLFVCKICSYAFCLVFSGLPVSLFVCLVTQCTICVWMFYFLFFKFSLVLNFFWFCYYILYLLFMLCVCMSF